MGDVNESKRRMEPRERPGWWGGLSTSSSSLRPKLKWFQSGIATGSMPVSSPSFSFEDERY